MCIFFFKFIECSCFLLGSPLSLIRLYKNSSKNMINYLIIEETCIIICYSNVSIIILAFNTFENFWSNEYFYKRLLRIKFHFSSDITQPKAFWTFDPSFVTLSLERKSYNLLFLGHLIYQIWIQYILILSKYVYHILIKYIHTHL